MSEEIKNGILRVTTTVDVDIKSLIALLASGQTIAPSARGGHFDQFLAASRSMAASSVVMTSTRALWYTARALRDASGNGIAAPFRTVVDAFIADRNDTDLQQQVDAVPMRAGLPDAPDSAVQEFFSIFEDDLKNIVGEDQFDGSKIDLAGKLALDMPLVDVAQILGNFFPF